MSQKIIMTPEDCTPFILSYCIKNVAINCGQIKLKSIYKHITHKAHVKVCLLNTLNPVAHRDFKCSSKICLNRKFSAAVKIRSGQKREEEYILHRSKWTHAQNPSKSCFALLLYLSGSPSQAKCNDSDTIHFPTISWLILFKIQRFFSIQPITPSNSDQILLYFCILCVFRAL